MVKVQEKSTASSSLPSESTYESNTASTEIVKNLLDPDEMPKITEETVDVPFEKEKEDDDISQET